MLRYSTSLTLGLWNTLCFGLLFFAWQFSNVKDIFINDATHITWVIAGLAALVFAHTTVSTLRLDRVAEASPALLAKRSAFIQFIKNEVLVILGIIGTLTGILIVTTVDPSMSQEARLAASTAGMHMGVGASLVGLISKLWCESMFYIKSARLRDLGWF